MTKLARLSNCRDRVKAETKISRNPEITLDQDFVRMKNQFSGIGFPTFFVISHSSFVIFNSAPTMTPLPYSAELRSEYALLIARRWFLRQCAVGLGSIALASLLGEDSARAAAAPAASNPLAPRQPHFKPKAKR